MLGQQEHQKKDEELLAVYKAIPTGLKAQYAGALEAQNEKLVI